MKSKNNIAGNAARRGALLLVVGMLCGLVFSPASSVSAQSSRVVPANTTIDLRVETPLDSRTARINDPFRARVVTPFSDGNLDVIPTNSMVNGRVLAVNNEANKSFGRPSGITLMIDSITSPTGATVRIAGDLIDDTGRPFVTVDNLPRDARVGLRINRQFGVDSNFYGGGDVFDTVDTITQAQIALRDRGYYNGRVDGRWSPILRAAISQFQRDQRLQATGFLDRETLRRLGLISESGGEVSPANVVSATAFTQPSGALVIRIVAQGGSTVQLFEDHFRFRDAVHVYVRGYRVTGSPRALPELLVTLPNNEWQGINRIVVHGSGNDIVIRSTDVGAGSFTAEDSAALEARVSEIVTQYSQILGLRYDRVTGQVRFTRTNYRENEVELLFALNALNGSMRMYTQLLRTSTDRQAILGGSDMVVANANAVERAASRVRSPRASGTTQTWATLREDFQRLSSNGSRTMGDAVSQY